VHIYLNNVKQKANTSLSDKWYITYIRPFSILYVI